MWRQRAWPTGWSIALLAVFWLWRAASHSLRANYGTPWAPVLAYGFLWDVLLVAGVILLHRVLRVHDRGRPQPGLRATVVSCMLLLASGITRAADVAYCAMTGAHWDGPGFLYLDLANAKLLAISDAGWLVGGMLAAAGLGSAFALFDGRRISARRDPDRPPARGRSAAAAFVLLLGPLAAGQGVTDDAPELFVPEANFTYQWLVWRGLVGGERRIMVPDDPTLLRLRALGLAPQQPTSDDYPLQRANIDPTPFPHPSRGDAAPSNLVFTFVEQLDHLYVHSFSGQLRGLTPEIDALSRRMTRVTDYRSTTNPTIHALVAALCSEYGIAYHRVLNAGKGGEALERTPLSCLPEILRRRGYRTVYIQGADETFSGKGAFLRTHGFEEVHDLQDVKSAYPKPRPSVWGARDRPLVNYAKDQVRRLEALREEDGRPYFLMVMTLDTHTPGFAPPGCRAPRAVRAIGRDRRSNRVLDAVHCSDRELGRLGRFILDDSKRAEQTVFMLTGDHPSPAHKFVRRLHEKMELPYQTWYGRLPLLIHDPRHVLPTEVSVLSGHTDIAPTLLHILGITDELNAMTGHSIFGLRPRFPLLLGRMDDRHIIVYTPLGVRRLSGTGLERACEKDQRFDELGPGAPEPCDLLSWKHWHNTLWTHKRLMPPLAVH